MNASKQAVYAFAFLTATMSPGVLASGLDCGSGPTLNVNQLPYSGINDIANSYYTIEDSDWDRAALMTRLVAIYRSTYGVTTLPPGAMVKVVFHDRSRECGVVVSRAGTIQAKPVPGTSRTAPGGGAGGVENTNFYLQQFQGNGDHGYYQICYDYYSNGELTETQCSVQAW